MEDWINYRAYDAVFVRKAMPLLERGYWRRVEEIRKIRKPICEVCSVLLGANQVNSGSYKQKTWCESMTTAVKQEKKLSYINISLPPFPNL